MTDSGDKNGIMLQVNEVRKTYTVDGNAVGAVDGASLEADAGEFVAVHGPSGCGKSTLLFMAGGLLAPDAGEIRVASENPYALNGAARARFRAKHVGFVFQDFNLVPYLSVLDNVMAPALVSGVGNGDLPEHAKDMLERFGLLDRQKHVPAELSAGERQRVSLARAFLLSPQLILADEPTGNLDRENTEIVLGHFAEYVKDNEAAVVMVTHDDQAVAKADRAIEMRDGMVIGGTA